MPTLLVIDDEPAVLHLFRRKFEADCMHVLCAESAADGLRLIAEEQPDVVILDIVLPDRNGIEAYRQIQEISAKLPVIFMTGTGNSDTAIEAMKLGALDYLTKPLDFAQVRDVVQQAVEIRRLMNEPVEVVQSADVLSAAGDALVGRCPAMQFVYKAIGRVAPQNVTVLIRGESGTGKELIARALYQHSKRSDAPFMEVNAAAIPETLLESELFGHEKGAFTGAERQRIGKFEQCNGGTLFLDEIGDMPPSLQSKMLRVLQEQRFERVGGSAAIRTDVRVIAATNRDLEKMVNENQFRSDLYYRLNGFTINLPPLRQRGDDLLLLIHHLIARANNDLCKNIRGISPQALDILQCYSWPGNIRELQNVIRQGVVQSTGPVLLADFLPDIVRITTPEQTANFPAESRANFWAQFVAERLGAGTQNLYDEAQESMEREIITRVLRHTGGNQVEASKILGITRTTLRSKVKQLGITIGHVIGSEDEQEDKSK